MEDEKYVYYQDLKEKKITGYSARKQRSHCGKAGCKLPSDYLTKKEIKNMSGECKSYRLNEPMSLEEFRTMPDDIKITYIKLIREKWNAPNVAVAAMMGTNKDVMYRELKRLGLTDGVRGHKVWEKEGFYAWAYGIPKKEETLEEILEETQGECVECYETVEEPVEVIEEEIPVAEEVPFVEIPKSELKIDRSTARNFAYPISGSMNFEGMAQDITAVLDALLFGKNIKMSVSWEVCND